MTFKELGTGGKFTFVGDGEIFFKRDFKSIICQRTHEKSYISEGLQGVYVNRIEDGQGGSIHVVESYSHRLQEEINEYMMYYWQSVAQDQYTSPFEKVIMAMGRVAMFANSQGVKKMIKDMASEEEKKINKRIVGEAAEIVINRRENNEQE